MKRRFNLDETKVLKDKNFNKKRKPIALKHVICGSVIISIFLLASFIFADCFTINQATIIGVAGASAATLFVLFFTLDKESRNDYKEAVISAKILCQILDSTYSQIEKIKNGWKHPITYSSSWMDYYKKCCVYLEYDYLEYLLREFEIIEKINSALAIDDKKELEEILEYRRKSIADWGTNFDIISVKHNLSCFVIGVEETKPWMLDGKFKEFKKYFLEKYTDRVKELTIEFLKCNSGHADSSLAKYYVMKELRKTLDWSDEKNKYDFMENKKVLNCIFTIYLSLNDDDEFSLCWDELTLKEHDVSK